LQNFQKSAKFLQNLAELVTSIFSAVSTKHSSAHSCLNAQKVAMKMNTWLQRCRIWRSSYESQSNEVEYFFPKRWLSGCIEVNRDDMCMCAREGGCERVRRWGGGGKPRRIPAGPKFPFPEKLYLDPVPRSYTPGPAVTFRPKIWFYLHKEFPRGPPPGLGGRSCRKRQFYNSKMHRAL